MELDGAIRTFVESQRVARLGTIGTDGHPHLVPVTFALLGDRFYSSIDEKPKRTTRLQRLLNLEADARATLLFDEYDEDWSQLAWVLVRGRGSLLEPGAEYAAAITALRARYPQYRSMALEVRPLLCVVPERVTRWQATRDAP